MTTILDIHTHTALPRLDALAAFEPDRLPRRDDYPGQLYSCGFHPWVLAEGGLPSEADFAMLAERLMREDVVAMGECGIDIPKGGTLAIQRMAFRRQAEMAEQVGKPVIIHCVKGQEHILGVHSELHPGKPWAIHGFLGKPEVARMFLDRGIWLCFGPQFNPETLRITPLELMLAETDDSGADIDEVIKRLEEARGESLRDVIAANTARFLGMALSD